HGLRVLAAQGFTAFVCPSLPAADTTSVSITRRDSIIRRLDRMYTPPLEPCRALHDITLMSSGASAVRCLCFLGPSTLAAPDQLGGDLSQFTSFRRHLPNPLQTTGAVQNSRPLIASSRILSPG